MAGCMNVGDFGGTYHAGRIAGSIAVVSKDTAEQMQPWQQGCV